MDKLFLDNKKGFFHYHKHTGNSDNCPACLLINRNIASAKIDKYYIDNKLHNLSAKKRNIKSGKARYNPWKRDKILMSGITEKYFNKKIKEMERKMKENNNPYGPSGSDSYYHGFFGYKYWQNNENIRLSPKMNRCSSAGTFDFNPKEEHSKNNIDNNNTMNNLISHDNSVNYPYIYQYFH